MEPKRMNKDSDLARKDATDVEEGDDRLSSLPDDLILKIFSFISIADAIRTVVLSSRWRVIWTLMPYLKFENLNPGPHIPKFISNVLSHRNNQIQVSSVSLVLGRTPSEIDDETDDETVARILNCAFTHNVQQLSVAYPPTRYGPYSFIPTPTWDLPSLTTLHLYNVNLSDDGGLFSKCTNLNNLSLKVCKMKETKVLNICHPRLSNLTLENTPPDKDFKEVVNVVAPQLKNLTIKHCQGKHLISAPGVTSLFIKGDHDHWQLSTPSGFHSLDTVVLLMFYPRKTDGPKLFSLFQHLRSVKLLTLNLGILQCLFSHNPDKACVLFANAKILKFIPKIHLNVFLEFQAQERVTTNYDTSPSAILPMVSREEVTAMGNIEKAKVFLELFRLLLRHCKVTTKDDANMAEYGKTQVEMYWAGEVQWNLRKMIALLQRTKIVQLENCRMMALFRQRYIGRLEVTHPILAWLQEMRALFECIQRFITQMSGSNQAVMQPIFLSLCEDAAILSNNMWGWMTTAK